MRKQEKQQEMGGDGPPPGAEGPPPDQGGPPPQQQ
jgi:hypothetical protein